MICHLKIWYFRCGAELANIWQFSENSLPQSDGDEHLAFTESEGIDMAMITGVKGGSYHI